MDTTDVTPNQTAQTLYKGLKYLGLAHTVYFKNRRIETKLVGTDEAVVILDCDTSQPLFAVVWVPQKKGWIVLTPNSDDFLAPWDPATRYLRTPIELVERLGHMLIDWATQKLQSTPDWDR